MAARVVFIGGGTIGAVDGSVSIRLPETYGILDVASAEHRLLVCVRLAPESASEPPLYRSELWQFETGGPSQSAVGFEERRVLMSIEPVGGIRYEFVAHAVICEEASAVYIEGYERGRTVVFTADGHPLDVDWRVQQDSGRMAGFSFVHPVAWIRSQESPIDPVKYSLICIGSHPGGDSQTVLTYDLGSGAVSATSLEDVAAELYPAMLHQLVWDN